MIGGNSESLNGYKSSGSYQNSYSSAYDNPSDSVASKGKPQNECTVVRNPGESTEKRAGRKSSPAECQTCSERKYQDGSDEDVSFKAAAHIDPNAAASRVRSHEQEHVSNAYKEAAQNNGKVIFCNVSISTSICPECGRTYVSGGNTATQIKYYNEENPYQKEMKASDAASKYRGRNLDTAF